MTIVTFSGVLKRLNPPKEKEWRIVGAACKESAEEIFAEWMLQVLRLDIPVGMQVEHSAEPLTSEPGHPHV